MCLANETRQADAGCQCDGPGRVCLRVSLARATPAVTVLRLTVSAMYCTSAATRPRVPAQGGCLLRVGVGCNEAGSYPHVKGRVGPLQPNPTFYFCLGFPHLSLPSAAGTPASALVFCRYKSSGHLRALASVERERERDGSGSECAVCSKFPPLAPCSPSFRAETLASFGKDACEDGEEEEEKQRTKCPRSPRSSVH